MLSLILAVEYSSETCGTWGLNILVWQEKCERIVIFAFAFFSRPKTLILVQKALQLKKKNRYPEKKLVF